MRIGVDKVQKALNTSNDARLAVLRIVNEVGNGLGYDRAKLLKTVTRFHKTRRRFFALRDAGMRIGVMLGIIVGLLGCGDVMSLNVDVDAGDGGAAGATGTGGSAPGRGGTTGSAGAGAVGGTGGSAPECIPDACNTCVENVLTPKPDGTLCGPGLCDGVLPYVGQGGCVSKNQACAVGVCTTTTIDCCHACPTPGPQAHCTAAAAEDPTIASYCTACVL